MTSFPGSPKTQKGGFVVMDSDGKSVLRTISFQYNPDTLTRTLTPREAKAESGDRLEALRLTGPPVETIKMDVELDAADKLEKAQLNPDTVANGLNPQLAALELLITPASADLSSAAQLANSGTIEVLPLPSPMLVLVLGTGRSLPVRITEFSIVEEAFDVNLNPIRARISLGLRVLTTEDLTPGSKGAEMFMTALKRREALAQRSGSAAS